MPGRKLEINADLMQHLEVLNELSNTLSLHRDAVVHYLDLLENFLIVERIKTQSYRLERANRYFWRTYTGAELDYIEERNGVLSGFEFKFSTKTAKAPQTWLDTYQNSTFQTVNREGYLGFLLGEV